MASAADVPGKFDVVINGQGYVLDSSFDPSVVYKSQKAEYGFTPQFIERQNVSGNLGDNQQDFFLTLSQNDWSGGEGQSFWRLSDTTTQNKYFAAARVNISVPGQLTMQNGESSSFGVLVNPKVASSAYGTKVPAAIAQTVTIATVDDTGALTTHGGHGLGTSPTCICADPLGVYVSAEGGGSVGIRRMDAATFAYTTFSVSDVSGLAYMDNTLFAARASSGELLKFSTAGVASTIFTWRDSAGTAAFPGALVRVVPSGSQHIFIVFDNEVWQYDGTNVNKVLEFSNSFRATDACAVEGTLYVAGALTGDPVYAAQIRFYDGSNEGLTWNSTATIPKMVPWKNGLVYSLGNTVNVGYFDLGTNAGSNIASLNGSVSGGIFTSASYVGGFTTGASADLVRLPGSGSGAFAVNFTSSWFDFESSLSKFFAGVQVIFDNPGAISINLTVTTDTGATTTFNGITSGTVYAPNISGRAIKYALNIPAASTGFVLKRVYLRAVPVVSQFRTAIYILDCTGNHNNPTTANLVTLRDGTTHTKDGQDMATDLVTAATSTVPFSITDRLGTFTGIIEAGALGLHEVRSNWGRGEFRALVTVRGT